MTGPTAVTLDELEQHAAAASKDDEKPDLSKINLEGDGIPEELKGKSVAELLKHTENVAEALKLSEEARLALRTSLDARPAAPAEPVTPAEPEPKQLSSEELATLYEEEPLKAITIMQEQAIAKVAGHYEKRLQPLFEGSATSAETLARKNFATEFELFGDEINNVISKMPDKSGLANMGTWEDIIAYVRGSKGNFERYMTHMTTKAAADAAAEAQNQQTLEAGFTTRPTTTPVVPQRVDQLDDVQKDIIDKLGMTPDEYVKWGYGGN